MARSPGLVIVPPFVRLFVHLSVCPRPWGESVSLSGILFRGLALGACAWLGLSLPARLQACSADDIPVLTGKYSKGANGLEPTQEALVALGRKVFFDPSLSASGRQACASCHSPAHGFGPPNALPVQPGGPHMDGFGLRATPSLRYQHGPQAFTEHYIDLMDNNGQDSGPAGGRTWDGRVNQAREQALMPLLDAQEMANHGLSDIVVRLRRAPYAAEFDALLSQPGTHILDDEEGVISWLLTAIEFYEQSPEDFHPFSSKYDDYLRGRVQLSAQEKRGFQIFNDPERGNCAKCHPSVATSSSVIFPRFTDFEFAALGVPRNRQIPANRDAQFFDLGLCGPVRHDLADHPEYCGMFRAPTLRNVATRQSYFHNGVFHSLREVLDFYATRDTDPQRWWGRGKARYDDLPARFHGNVNQDPPFKPLPNGQPRLSSRDIDDLLAFLNTLTDRDLVTPTRPRPSAKRTMALTGPGHPIISK